MRDLVDEYAATDGGAVDVLPTFDQMTQVQRRLHNAAVVLGADGDEHGFEGLQLDAIAEIQRLRTIVSKAEHWARHEMLMRSAQNAELLSILTPNT